MAKRTCFGELCAITGLFSWFNKISWPCVLSSKIDVLNNRLNYKVP